MTDTTRIQYLLDATKQLDKLFLQHQTPLTVEERKELLQAHNKVWYTINNVMPMQQICANCEYCVEWEGKTCCAARKGCPPIPFNVVNRVGGCSLWKDKDYVPF